MKPITYVMASRKTLLIALFCSLPLFAQANGQVNENFCLDQNNQKEFADLLAKNLADTRIVQLVALRQGLCELLGNQQLPLATAVDIWAHERQKILLERTKKRLNRLKQKTD